MIGGAALLALLAAASAASSLAIPQADSTRDPAPTVVPQVGSLSPTAAAPAPLAPRAMGRDVRTGPLGGSDACDPRRLAQASERLREICARSLERRAAEIGPPPPREPPPESMPLELRPGRRSDPPVAVKAMAAGTLRPPPEPSKPAAPPEAVAPPGVPLVDFTPQPR